MTSSIRVESASTPMTKKALTGQRLKVLSILQAHQKAIKAYDILAILQQDEPSLAPTIVYRALDYLMTHGYVHKLDAINAFIACEHHYDDDHYSVILVCDKCHHTHEIPLQPMPYLDALAANAQFQMFEQDITIKGLCKECVDHA